VKLGIVSDIHEAVELLRRALERFEREAVDRVVLLGDVFETGPRIDETVDVLLEAGVEGVYGNHDYGLSVDPDEYIRSRFSRKVLDFMTSLRPRLEIDGCLFAHREPWLDCSILSQIWHVDEQELTPALIARSFQATPHRSIFVGHFHRWHAFGREAPLPWEGREPLALPHDGPTLVVVHAVCDGFAATFDTTSRLLAPIDLYRGTRRPETRPIPPLVSG
jgi:Calcineurin-like phosphoesterase superfamily domain